MSNGGLITFEILDLINGSSYDQSLYCQNVT